MAFRILTLVFVALTIMLMPAALTGCGTDTEGSSSQVSLTVGPGNLGPEDLKLPGKKTGNVVVAPLK
ncbi:MAG: hypothetical protein WA705_26555 [Candidatus Ozemobacteraceae bacterium]